MKNKKKIIANIVVNTDRVVDTDFQIDQDTSEIRKKENIVSKDPVIPPAECDNKNVF